MKPFSIILTTATAAVVILGVSPTRHAAAAIYQCTDATGSTIFTDGIAQLRNCVPVNMNVPSSTPAHPPAAAGAAMGSPQPIVPTSGMVYPASQPPTAMDPNFVEPVPAMGSPEQTIVAAPPLPDSPPAQPCMRPINPLNPLVTRPCLPGEEQIIQPVAPPGAVIRPLGTE